MDEKQTIKAVSDILKRQGCSKRKIAATKRAMRLAFKQGEPVKVTLNGKTV